MGLGQVSLMRMFVLCLCSCSTAVDYKWLMPESIQVCGTSACSRNLTPGRIVYQMPIAMQIRIS